MDKSRDLHTEGSQEPIGEVNWAEIYPRLRVLARHLVNKHWIPRWRGQEEEIADDVTQETAKRFIERQRKATRGEASPIDLPENMMAVIAHNYVRDLVAREQRVIHAPIEELTPLLRQRENHCVLIDEIAVENVSNERFFLQMAQVVVNFPSKRRVVLLTDLANRMCFEEEPTALQAAFLAVGIDLKAYQMPVPINTVERSRYAALLCLAYASLERHASIQEDSQVA